MTIGGIIIGFIFSAVFIILCAVICVSISDTSTSPTAGIVLTILVTGILLIAMWGGMYWYFNNTASGQRKLLDEKSELGNGLDRTITIYTADGNIIAQYNGKIDIEQNDGGYIKFDFNGKRYIYYNCFVESIADIVQIGGFAFEN